MSYQQKQNDQTQPLLQDQNFQDQQLTTVVSGAPILSSQSSINTYEDDVNFFEQDEETKEGTKSDKKQRRKESKVKHKRKERGIREKLNIGGGDSDDEDSGFLKSEKSLKDVVISSSFNKYKDPKQRLQAIDKEFDGSRASYMTEAACCGKRVKPDEVLLVHANYKTQLVLPTSNIM